MNKNDLYFAKLMPDAIIPTKSEENAGYDIYANTTLDFIHIGKMETKLVSTGIACAVGNDYYLQVEERGSTGSKGIKKSAGVIDSGYRGEIFIAITNCTGKDLLISKLTKKQLIDKYGKEIDGIKYVITGDGKKVDIKDDCIIYPYSKAIAQLVVHEVPKMNVIEISSNELQNIPSERGTGNLGSSGK